jgi:hypothetical protein
VCCASLPTPPRTLPEGGLGLDSRALAVITGAASTQCTLQYRARPLPADDKIPSTRLAPLFLLLHTLRQIHRHHQLPRSLQVYLVSLLCSIVVRDHPEPSIKSSCFPGTLAIFWVGRLTPKAACLQSADTSKGPLALGWPHQCLIQHYQSLFGPAIANTLQGNP